MNGSSIKNLQDTYRKYSEFLPEELSDPSIHEELASSKQELQNILDEDTEFLRKLLQKNNNRINLKEYEKSDALLIRRGFLQKNEQLTDNEWTKFFIAHLFMCKSTLLHLSNLLLDTLPLVNEYFSKYNTSSADKRHAFINLTREYQNLIGLVVNIIDVIAEYYEVFNVIWKRLDPNFVDNGSRHLVSAIIHDELVEGSLELLLRGNRGRFTPAPLIRSALEIMVMRTVFNTKYSK